MKKYSITLLMLFTVLSGCSEDTSTTFKNEYFPMGVGMRWVYDIQLPSEKEALKSGVMRWPLEDGELADGVRTKLGADDKSKSNLQLVFTLQEVDIEHKPFDSFKGFELKIETDDVNLFRFHEGVFWGISKFDHGSIKIVIKEVVTFPRKSFLAPRLEKPELLISSGYTSSPLFFNSENNKPAAFRIDNKYEKVGFEYFGIRKLNGIPCLYFQRSISGSGSDDHFSKPIDENIWFENGKGLVRLVQKIGGETTMIMTLKDISKPMSMSN